MNIRSIHRLSRLAALIVLLNLMALAHTYAQRASGVIAINRFGVSYQRAFGVDLGLIAYNTLYGSQERSFYDVSLGFESVFARQFALVPKLNVDVGIRSSLFDAATLGGGVDVGWYTDFSGGDWRITPKAGITLGSVFRLYYGYHHYASESVPLRTSRHRISFELNIAAFHDFKIGF
ncbi:hypothetical protein ACFQRK_10475 [Parapedobacter sp. GCM10030251]|uniref:hypothetical protein n=1 Tax=Parapedobacter sp. GCM10030251 TaxID=3273419 RepID=UPI00361D820C